MPVATYFRLTEDVSPLPDHILVHNMDKGGRISRGGIILRDDNGKNEGIRPRWAQVYKVGRNIDFVKAGEWVLVEHGRWTYGVPVELEGQEELYIQRIDTDAILLVADEQVPE